MFSSLFFFLQKKSVNMYEARIISLRDNNCQNEWTATVNVNIVVLTCVLYDGWKSKMSASADLCHF